MTNTMSEREFAGDKVGAVRTVIFNGRVVAPEGDIEDGVVVIEGGRIRFVGPAAGRRKTERFALRGERPAADRDFPATASDTVWVDARGGWICPGFIDIHVHGGGGADVMDANAEALQTVARTHARHGTTAFLATTVAAPHRKLMEVAEVVAQMAAGPTGSRPAGGAQLLGLHLEGPYINPRRAGAQNPAHIRRPDLKELQQLYEVLGPVWRIITIAPELPDAESAVRWLTERGVLASMGHTDATYEEAKAAVEVGVRHATHLFNAMRPCHHRDPGCIAAVLDDDRVGAEIIADGQHVHPAALRLAFRTKGPNRLCLVTDCIRALGMPDGVYRLGDVDVSVRDGRTRLADDEDAPAGSLLTMADAVRTMVRRAGVSLRDAVAMASVNPARAAGAADFKGALDPGKDGDVVVLDDDLAVRAVVVAGQVVYSQ